MLKIYHAKNPTFGFTLPPLKDPKFPRDYELVASIEAESLDQAFRLSNNIVQNWANHPAVRDPVRNHLRSTSVGDVIETEDGSIWRCENVGWSQLNPETHA